eukprot:68019-Rhodomonas_salina.1
MWVPTPQHLHPHLQQLPRAQARAMEHEQGAPAPLWVVLVDAKAAKGVGGDGMDRGGGGWARELVWEAARGGPSPQLQPAAADALWHTESMSASAAMQGR